ncbi:hypothetical protein L3Y34_006574 [Caenorhabditis briggsae]|uniref:T20D4.11-like domain-containing protein n=1 Tax=Caenorhabditis briggsae TaxID=6238 RepID=A0AAE9A4L2_CAEBR|nr:hypothetical protein L3Y34_006574 [Caenorhabditis briggsae]
MIFLLFSISFSYGNAASIFQTEANITTCIENFYAAVYSENYNCTSQYDFASNNETVAQKSLISGKSCALEILGETCTQSQFTEISSKFENFVKSLTTEPKDKNCTDSYYRSNAFKCLGLLTSLRGKMKLIFQTQPKINDSRLLNLIDQCESFKENSTSEIFKSGKSCFLQIAEEECSVSQYNLLSTRYQDFLDVITKKPKNESDCENFHFKYNAIKCQPLMDDLGLKDAVLQKRHTKINDSRVLELIDLCDNALTCMSSNCYYFKTEVSIVSTFCETVKMSNSEFKACEWKIERESPDLSEYECLEGDDFYDPAILNKYRFYTKMKDCTKEIMMDICGEKAVVGFEKYAELSADFLIKAAKMQRAMSEVMDEDGSENDEEDD